MCLNRRVRVACVIAGMGPGGAQRVMAQLCNHLVRKGHTITLIELDAERTGSFFALDDQVRRIDLAKASLPNLKILRIAGRLYNLRRAVAASGADIVLSFIGRTNIMTLIATRGLGVPVIVSERNDPSHYRLGAVTERLRRLSYPLAARLVVQTKRTAAFFADLPRVNLVVLANPVPPSRERAEPAVAGAGGCFRIIGVGRLHPQKGYDRLLAAFARLAGRFPDWTIIVFGEGGERNRLEAMAQDLGLSGRVRLLPPTRQIASELGRAHIFAFPSRYEGFPNALAEAMAAGLPAIGYNDVSGVEDLIIDGVSGLLADTGLDETTATEALATGLERLMSDPCLRARLGAAAVARIASFAPEQILGDWERLLIGVASEQRHDRV